MEECVRVVSALLFLVLFLVISVLSSWISQGEDIGIGRAVLGGGRYEGWELRSYGWFGNERYTQTRKCVALNEVTECGSL